MSVDDEKLVDCLKTNPCLWDKNRQDFRSSALKDAKWKEIAAELDSTSSKVMRRYRTLRERFRRETIKCRQDPKLVSKWILYDRINFLKEFQIPREVRFAKKHNIIDVRFNAVRNDINNRNKGRNHSIGKNNSVNRKLDADTENGLALVTDLPVNNPVIGINELDQEKEEDDAEGLSYRLVPADGGNNNEWIGAQMSVANLNINERNNKTRRINMITSFCEYMNANLNLMTDDQIDQVIEDMTVLLFRRKRAFRRSCDARM